MPPEGRRKNWSSFTTKMKIGKFSAIPTNRKFFGLHKKKLYLGCHGYPEPVVSLTTEHAMPTICRTNINVVIIIVIIMLFKYVR